VPSLASDVTPGARRPLRVGIDEKHAMTASAELGGEVYRNRRLPNSTFLGDKGNDHAPTFGQLTVSSKFLDVNP
jgi:hypothetical protein